jgi:peptidoglycan hydrolase-like protein with peptidoglycan-binding domain
MKKFIVASAVVTSTLLGATNLNIPTAQAGYSRCQEGASRGAYCFKLGDRGPLVYQLIEKLRCTGYYNAGNDSYFGPVTERAVIRFQSDRGLVADGVVGPDTYRRLTCSGNVSQRRPREDSNVPDETSIAQTETFPDQNSKTIEFEDIDVTLRGCKRSPSTVKCYFTLSTKKDGTGGFYCDYTKMFDLYGNEYFCEQGQLGQAKGKHGTEAATRMLTGIPLAAIATFRNIPARVKEIAALEVGVALSEPNGGRPYAAQHQAEFRNIPISE